MSIENNLAIIANSLETIARYLTSGALNATPVAPSPVVVIPPAVTVTAPVIASTAPPPAPVAPATPVPVVTVSSTPVMAIPSGAPFSDTKGMIGYVMSKYKALGAEKGARIQEVLKGLGVVNINEVRADQYAALYAGVESLS
jgi:hypothetical protein